MCIIVHKPKGIELPSKKTLKTCWERNPDGAGYMFNLNDKVVIKKGFMKFKTFYKSLTHDYKIVDGDTKSFVLHFRISTQGGVNPQLTHPFPLSAEMNDLRQLLFTSDIGIAHNGIIDLTSVGSLKQVTYSDTMTFITDYLSLIINDRDYHKDTKTLTLIERLAGSKLAIMDGSGLVTRIGAFIEDEGCYYSNGNYKPVTYSYYPSYRHDTTNKYYLAKDGLSWGEHINMVDEMFGPYDDDIIDSMVTYDFTPTYCPCTEYGTEYYCKKCINYHTCWKHLNEEKEI